MLSLIIRSVLLSGPFGDRREVEGTGSVDSRLKNGALAERSKKRDFATSLPNQRIGQNGGSSPNGLPTDFAGGFLLLSAIKISVMFDDRVDKFGH